MSLSSALISKFQKHIGIAFVLALLLSLAPGAAAQDNPDDLPGGVPVRTAAAQPTNVWVVQLAPGVNPDAAAASSGAQNLGQVPNLPGYYRFVMGAVNAANTFDAVQVTRSLRAAPGVTFAQQEIKRPFAKRQEPTDPFYDLQWHLKNTGQYGGVVDNDINVVAAWNLGYTGSGVVVGVIDDGPEYTHSDLADNWRGDLAYDYYDHDNDPAPEYDAPFFGEAHGTSVAGIAAGSDNGACGVGVAYNAGIAGVRLVVDAFSDAQAASALAHAVDSVDIYNNSWGPYDDGVEWNGSGKASLDAIELGALTGRDGKGMVYVWAGGNGGSNDHTGADGFVNSRYTIAVGASTTDGEKSVYSEVGAALLVNAPSSGGGAGTVTTDRVGEPGYSNGNSNHMIIDPGPPELPFNSTDCTDQFGGTSSAAPTVAGVVALMLQANPDLTWRDVQAILIESAEKNDAGDSEWTLNGADYPVNQKYGFGRVDAGAAAALAATWTNLAPEVKVESATKVLNKAIPDGNLNGLVIPLEVFKDVQIESVQLVVDAKHRSRGDLQIELTSPAGTVSKLLLPRKRDTTLTGNVYATAHIKNYPFLSMRHFGESSTGVWTARIIDTKGGVVGTLNSVRLHIYGVPRFTVQELVSNGSFELLTDPNVLPDDWTATGLKPSDKWVENTGAQTVASEGTHAFQLSGRKGKTTQMRQVLDGSALVEGDTLVVGARVKTVELSAGARLRLRATYAGGGVDTITIKIPNGTNPFSLLTDALTLDETPTKLIVDVQVSGPKAKGKFYLDDVRVEQVSAVLFAVDGGLVPLPDPPTGAGEGSLRD